MSKQRSGPAGYWLLLLTFGLIGLLPGRAWSMAAPAPATQNFICANVKTLYRVRLNDAQIGDRDAQFALANMYMTGQGVARDFRKAFYWYQLAAFQRHPGAQFRLAVLYSNGKSVRKDLAMAYFWFSMARNQGIEDADGDLRYLRHILTDDQRSQVQRLFRRLVTVVGTPASE